VVTKPTLAMIGEAGPEAVVPLSKVGSLSGTAGTSASATPVVVNINGALDPLAVARQVEQVLRKLERATGRPLLVPPR
jgi:hypothetical protein